MSDTYQLSCQNCGDLGPADTEAQAQQLLTRHTRIWACSRSAVDFRSVDTGTDHPDSTDESDGDA